MLLVCSYLGPVVGVPWGGPSSTRHETSNRVAGDERSRARIHFSFPFDSCRGYPGEGPGLPPAARHSILGDRINTNKTGDGRQLRSTSRVSFANEPSQRARVGGGSRFTRGGIRDKGGGLPVHVPATAVASSSPASTGKGLGIGSFTGDREALQDMSRHRKSSGTRRRQMSSFLGPQFRKKNTPSGTMASRTTDSDTDIRHGGEDLRRPAEFPLSTEESSRAPASRFRERCVHGTEKRRRISPLYRLQGTKQICREAKVSDGGSERGGRDDTAERLRDAGGFERLLPNSWLAPSASQVLQVPLPSDGDTLPVENGVVRDVRSTKDLHEDFAPTDRHPQVLRNSVPHLHRRSLITRPGRSPSGEIDGNRNGAPAETSGTSAQAIKGKSLSLSTLHVLGNNMGYYETNVPHTCKTHEGNSANGSATSQVVDAYGRSRRRSPSANKGLGPFRRPGCVDVQGDPLSETSAAAYPAHSFEDSSAKGMERHNHLITNDKTSVRMVDNERALEGERKRHRTSSQAHPDLTANGRSDSQRRLRWSDDLRQQGVHHERVPDGRRAERGLYQSVRVLGLREQLMGSAPGSCSQSEIVEQGSRFGRARQRNKHQVWSGGGKPLDTNVTDGCAILRPGGSSRDSSQLQALGGGIERVGGQTESSALHTRRLEVGRRPFSADTVAPRRNPPRGFVRKFTKHAASQVLFLQPRPQGGRSGRIPLPVDEPRDDVCIPPSDTTGSGTPKAARRLMSSFDRCGPSVDGSNMVSNSVGDAEGTPTPTAQQTLDSDESIGGPLLAGEVASMRMRFIWRFGARKGITKAVFRKRWADSKNGYPQQYDAPFESFKLWWDDAHPSLEFSPANIQPGLLTTYLTGLSARGVHHDILRDVSTSISMACVEASDQQYQPGKSFTVSKFFEGERRRKPTRRLGTGEYSDVALLYNELWKYGPSDALTIGQKKKRLVALLAADSAARPSDLARLFRVYDGWKQQIVFTDWGVRLRFFYTKEIVPGSSRDNATGYWFTTWVHIHKTTPREISTPEILRDYLDSTSGPEYATQHISELDSDAQPLVFARKRSGKWQPASVDHVSNLVKESLEESSMRSMTMKGIRGASPSKLVQLFPSCMSSALALGRWTTRKTFCNHYQAPVKLVMEETPSAEMADNVQQVLRWGFAPSPPPNVSAEEYMKGPSYWVGKKYSYLSILSFDEGIYATAAEGVFAPVVGAKEELYHYELMEAVSKARS